LHLSCGHALGRPEAALGTTNGSEQ
jgi:hypothetical protein